MFKYRKIVVLSEDRINSYECGKSPQVFLMLGIFALLAWSCFSAFYYIDTEIKLASAIDDKEIVKLKYIRAGEKNEELVARLGKFERELEEMRVTAAEDAKQDAARIVERAEAEAKRIAESSERSISEETRRAKASLRKEAVDLAVQLAETTLSKEVQADDQRRLEGGNKGFFGPPAWCFC